MWKTVSARLRGSDTELKEMGEDTDNLVTSTSKLQAKVKALTGGFDIMQDKNTYKDIYDIVVGIGEKWADMNDISRASLLEMLAGKTQSNALAAAFDNVNVIKDAYATAENSDGSAERELKNYQKGVEYSLDRIKASFQEFSTITLDSNIFKGIVDSGNAALNVVTSLISEFGGLQTAISGIAAYFLQKNGSGKQTICFNIIIV